MRRVAFALVVANVLAFAWWRGWLDDWLETGREPQRAGRQVAADRVRVVPVERFDAARASARAACAEGAPCDAEPAPDARTDQPADAAPDAKAGKAGAK